MLMIHTSLFRLPKQLVRVWRNEFTRVICDRLSSEKVRNAFFPDTHFLHHSNKLIALRNVKQQLQHMDIRIEKKKMRKCLRVFFFSFMAMCVSCVATIFTWQKIAYNVQKYIEDVVCVACACASMTCSWLWCYCLLIIRAPNRFYRSLCASNIYLMRISKEEKHFLKWMVFLLFSFFYVLFYFFFFFGMYVSSSTPSSLCIKCVVLNTILAVIYILFYCGYKPYLLQSTGINVWRVCICIISAIGTCCGYAFKKPTTTSTATMLMLFFTMVKTSTMNCTNNNNARATTNETKKKCI